MESRDDAGSNVIVPDSQTCSFKWFSSEEPRVVRWIRILEELANNGAFVECFAFIF